MQVKITFTVDMDEVPSRVDKQLIEGMHILRDIFDGKLSEVSRENAVSTLDWIERTRKKLLQVDTKMADCYNILLGYNKAVAEQMLPPQIEEGHDDSQS